MISIRQHCIPSFDELSRLRKVKEIPKELDSMEEQTASGIVFKFYNIVNSDYFNSLPEYATIQSGAIDNYSWKKSDVKKECERIYNDCKAYLINNQYDRK